MASSQKLFRSTRYNTFGGVCAGLALNKGWSISVTRTLALLFMSVSGLGLLVYIALWIAVPSAKSLGIAEPDTFPHDSFLRSRHDRRVAGVCGGLARWLEVDSVWIRVAYVLAVLCGGLGLISYVYAWMIVPEEPMA